MTLQVGHDAVFETGPSQLGMGAAAQVGGELGYECGLERQIGFQVPRCEHLAREAALDIALGRGPRARERDVSGNFSGHEPDGMQLPSEVPECPSLHGEPHAAAAPDRSFRCGA